ncbi:MAG: FMN-binding protein, partial [Eubacterium sp.]|nr:FMN-binding protein [Eubacterium sp.]
MKKMIRNEKKTGSLWLLLALLPLFWLITAGTVYAAGRDGVYEGTGQGRNGKIRVSVEFENDSVKSIEVIEQDETEDYWESASILLDKLIGVSSAQDIQAVDSVSGATLSSQGIKEAVSDALARASDEI